jgi:hypothetical protein
MRPECARARAGVMGEKGKVAIIMYEIYELFERVITEALALGSHIELRPALEKHFPREYTWSARIPGRGVYMGQASNCYGEDGERCIAFEHPDTFEPEE